MPFDHSMVEMNQPEVEAVEERSQAKRRRTRNWWMNRKDNRQMENLAKWVNQWTWMMNNIAVGDC